MADLSGEELTHDEVWDDSDLVQNWNEAFEEYKKYHSLAARGEKAEDTAASHTKSRLNGVPKASETPVNFIGPAAAPPAVPQVDAASANAAQSAANFPLTAPAGPPGPPGLASLPQTLLSTQDDALRNIMMSWYYAGYYTGLYEGQQKAWASMQEAQQQG